MSIEYIINVSYKADNGIDQELDNRIETFVGEDNCVGSGYCFMSRFRDIEFSFDDKSNHDSVIDILNKEFDEEILSGLIIINSWEDED